MVTVDWDIFHRSKREKQRHCAVGQRSLRSQTRLKSGVTYRALPHMPRHSMIR